MSITFSGRELLEIAIQIEKNGFTFYANVARKVAEPKVIEVINWLAQEENSHIKRFEEIGFIFKPHDESFDNGFRQTLKYKEEFGDPNAPDSCKLGKWQGKQRQSYKKGKLSPERIKRFEEIGFKWQLKKRREA